MSAHKDLVKQREMLVRTRQKTVSLLEELDISIGRVDRMIEAETEVKRIVADMHAQDLHGL